MSTRYRSAEDVLLDGPFTGMSIIEVYSHGEYHYLLAMIESGEWDANSYQRKHLPEILHHMICCEALLDDESYYEDNHE